MKISAFGPARIAAFCLVLVAVPALAAVVQSSSPGAAVDGAKIADADSDPGEWLSHGRTYSEQRFSPLDKINTTNGKSLGVESEYCTYSLRGL
jgi:quinohemoprotein ethanol dehydrogenase